MKNKYLITGFSGFAAKHFLDFLDRNSNNVIVVGIDIIDPKINYKNISIYFEKINMLDKEHLESVIISYQPDYILHLASFSSVAFSWKNPIVSFTNNTNIFLNLLDIVRESNCNCRILSIGSSEQYGNVNTEDIPLTEKHPLNPVSPYAVARVSQELLSKIYIEGYGMDIVMTRSFNHLGPGQKDNFVIPSFIKQLISARNKGVSESKIITGDVNIIRDFTDVRDVVKAYYLLFKKGKSGEVYNVCSGIGYSLKELIKILSDSIDIKFTIEVDDKLIRPNDNKIIVGSNEKIESQIGWEPKFDIIHSLNDMINYY